MFVWDAKKAATNLAKHGVAFDAIHDFDWTAALISVDDRIDYGEERLMGFGPIGSRIYAVCFTRTKAGTRIISLRKANDREVKVYAAQTAHR